MRRVARILLCTCLVQLLVFHARSQTKPTLLLLTDYIDILEKHHPVTFLFDSDLLQGVKIQADTTRGDFDAAVKNLKSLKAFDFAWDGSSTVSVIPRKEKANLFICATIIDRETQNVIAGARILDKRGAFEASANESGYFETYGRLSETNSITVSSVGYLPVSLSMEYFNGTGCPIIELKPSTEILKDIVINSYMTTGIDYEFRENAIVLQPGRVGLLPGETDADILTAVDALPGINSPDSKAGNLVIRGSTPDQSLITFDNIPIYHKGHYFGTNSPYNPIVVDNVKVLRSACTAERGGRVGGVIEMNSSNRLADSATYAVALSTTYGSAFTEFPLVKDKVTLLLAARASLPHEWNSPKLAAINDFIYQQTRVQEAKREPTLHLTDHDYSFNDFNAKIISQPNVNNSLTASLLLIKNDVDIGIANDREQSLTGDNMRLMNRGLNLQWEKRWSDNLKTTVIGTQSVYDQQNNSRTTSLPEDTVRSASFFENELNDISLKLKSEWKLGHGLSSGFGYELQHQAQQYTHNSQATARNEEASAYLHSFYINLNLLQHARYMLSAGVRNNYYARTQDFRIEPRMMFNYFVNDHFTLKTSGGFFNQYVSQISGVAIESVGGIENQVWQIADGKKVPVVSSRQAMAGAMYHTDSWILDLEAYHNSIDNITINNIFTFSDNYFYGSGNTLGVDLLIKKQWKQVEGWVSYTVSKSQLHFDSINVKDFEFIYDQTHVIDVVASYKLKNWKISGGWKYRTGLPALPGIRTRYIHGAPSFGPTGPPPNGGGTRPPTGAREVYNDRFPDYQQIDLSVVYLLEPAGKSYRGSIGVSLVNILDRENIIEQIPRPGANGNIVSNKYAIGFAPSLTLMMKW